MDDIGISHLIGALEPHYVMPSRRYITETIMPKLYEKYKKGVKSQLKGVPHFSFTSNLWSTTVNVISLMSLTAHWVTVDFVRKRVFCMHSLLKDHTLGNKYKGCFRKC